MSHCNNCNACDPSRRNLLRTGAFAFLGVSAAGNAIARAATSATPSETEGPFWEDEGAVAAYTTLANRSDVRTDLATGVAEPGLPVLLSVTLSKLSNGTAAPVPNAKIDIWHANAYGNYSDEPAGMGNANTLGKTYLRGYQYTDAHGIVRFTTIYPGFYSGRTAHIHARVRLYSGTTLTTNYTTQFFFTDAISNAVYQSYAPYNTRTGLGNRTTNTTDNVYNTVSTGSTAANPDGSRLLLRMSDATNAHVVASYKIVLA